MMDKALLAYLLIQAILALLLESGTARAAEQPQCEVPDLAFMQFEPFDINFMQFHLSASELEADETKELSDPTIKSAEANIARLEAEMQEAAQKVKKMKDKLEAAQKIRQENGDVHAKIDEADIEFGGDFEEEMKVAMNAVKRVKEEAREKRNTEAEEQAKGADEAAEQAKMAEDPEEEAKMAEEAKEQEKRAEEAEEKAKRDAEMKEAEEKRIKEAKAKRKNEVEAKKKKVDVLDW